MNFSKAIVVFICIGVLCLSSSTTAQEDIKWSWNDKGEFYLYSEFIRGSSEFKGGGDVDTYGNLIYVNRDGKVVDVYEVSIPDSTKQSMHPDNPEVTGPIEPRTLTFKESYNVPGLSWPTTGELFAVDSGLYYLYDRNVNYFDFETKKKKVICNSSKLVPAMHLLGYDDLNDIWYAGGRDTRTVYSFNKTSKDWDVEFTFDTLFGEHFDGLEVIATEKNTKIYVSDMTSDYIGVINNESGTWKEQSLNQYDGSAGYVEGMGYGALSHFWITTGGTGLMTADSGTLYEIGGGGLVVEIPETVTVSIPVEQSFTIEENSAAGTKVGDITINSSDVTKAQIKIINNIPEFEVDSLSPFTIKVANGAVLDFSKQTTFQLLVIVTAKAGIITKPDTSVVTINIAQKTGVGGSLNMANRAVSFKIKDNKLIINDLASRTYNLSITNVKGQNVMSLSNTNSAIVDLSAIPSGVYFLNIKCNGKKIFSKMCIDK